MRPPEREPVSPMAAPADVVAVSPAMVAVLDMARMAGRSDAKVLITGESGVGKDVVARFIHHASRRATGPYVPVNCAGVPETLLESELFGAVRGSYTGAYRDRPGRLAEAHHGTLFLDEVGEMSLRMQAMLLRFLESGEVQPVGSEGRPLVVDVRVISATNRDLAARVEAGAFRDDLLYRLRVIHIDVPPLRERPEDLEPLITRALARLGLARTIGAAAMAVLRHYHWPGNVRELQNVVEQAAWRTDTDVIGAEHLPLSVAGHEGLRSPLERRRQTADDLYEALVKDGASFWREVHDRFLDRDLTRHDVRELVRLGLVATHGNYRALVELFGLPAADYKRFMNFLAAHDCTVDFHRF
ncbi:MAG: sigma 54-interacting transcriptional regulator, partial [Vicinamibacteraceae bacterium]|nr:sigma 54-interacting transcriptional regulator [Vicinamibacteraceae bacterium]